MMPKLIFRRMLFTLAAAGMMAASPSLFAKVTVGEMAVETDLVFGPGENEGRKGVLVTLQDVAVSGHKGETVYAYARILKDADPPFCEKQLILKLTSAVQKFPRMQFRFPYAEIREIYGADKRTFFAQFMFYTFAGSLPEILDAFYIQKKIAFAPAAEADADPPDPRLAASREYLAARAAHNGTFAKALGLSERTGLLFYVRGYRLSAAAAQDYTVADPEPGDEELVALGLETLVPFLETWPEDFFRTSRLKGVAFTAGVTFYDHRVGGGLDGSNRIVLLDVSTLRNDVNAGFLHVFCHELFHHLEKVFYRHIDADRWQALNPRGFAYDRQGAMDFVLNGRTDAMKEHFAKGFVTRYAASDHYQDTAETFAYLMIPDLRRKAEAWCAADPYLKAKLDYLKSVLKKIFPGLDVDE